jgi:transcriptional regulator with GAF, ATPase, and Fis domain
MNMNALHEVVFAIAQQRSVAAVLQKIVEGIADMTGGGFTMKTEACLDAALVRIWRVAPGDICGECRFKSECPDQSKCLHLVASVGTPTDKSEDWSRLNGHFRRFPIGVRKIGHIAATGQPIVIPEMANDSTWIARPDWVRTERIITFSGHPLIFRDETLAVLGVFSRTAFRPGDFERLQSFANHAAVAIANARAFEEIEALKARLEQENVYLREEVTEALGTRDIVGQSPVLRKVLQQIELVAPTDAAVLIHGESGTGKELVARALHERSPRRGRPLIKVNCGAIPENLFESEFFGHARGAFTGALKDKPGRFELADGGTLFLDEIGELPLAMQSKLLRVLQEQEIERVGETQPRKINVRIVAASNRNLKSEVDAGRFRQDLFYRLSVFPIEVPALRERRDDIGPLALHFVRQTAAKMNRPTPRLTQGHVDQLSAYDWPGNIRELQNAAERAVILSQGGPLRFDLPSPEMPRHTTQPIAVGDPVPTRNELKRRERESIEAALAITRGKIFGPGGAAELLGMRPTTLASRLKALGIEKRRTP